MTTVTMTTVTMTTVIMTTVTITTVTITTVTMKTVTMKTVTMTTDTMKTVTVTSPPQNPQCDLQAQDRAHRIGQKNKVMVYRFLTKNTMDQKIVERGISKRFLEKMVIHKGMCSYYLNIEWTKFESRFYVVPFLKVLRIFATW